MNRIMQQVTPDGLVSRDEHGQTWVKWRPLDDDCVQSTVIRDPANDICPLCYQGWIRTGSGYQDQVFDHQRKSLFHLSCWKRHIAVNEYDMVYGALCTAGLTFQEMSTIRNEYGSWEPWFTIYLDKSFMDQIKFGRRKRVWDIELMVSEPSPGARTLPKDIYDGLALGKDDTTKSYSANRVMVHAWTREKVVEYFSNFKQLLVDIPPYK